MSESQPERRLAGKTALITGAGAGIGAAAARLFCREGAAVLLVDADAQALARTQAAILQAQPDARLASVSADVSDAAAAVAAVVVPGHMKPATVTDASAIRYTRDYLLAFEEELGKAADSAALIAAMTARYPDAGMGVALQIGAKVAKGEMEWG